MANEKRLIDANVLAEQFNDSFNSFVMKRIIEMQPTVEAVEVVRCKDCKHWTECESSLIGNVMCCTGQGSAYIQKAADDFCSYGERREGE